jgi:glycosyltransferase involved in cell wall biosynthesis
VATRISGHLDAVRDGRSGLLGADARELVAHLDAVLGDEALRGRLAAGALEHAAGLTWQATARGTLEALVADALSRR